MTDDPVTPELALVDPSLRNQLLAEMPAASPPGPADRVRQIKEREPAALIEQIPARAEPSDGSPSYRRRLTVPLLVAAFSSLVTLAAVAIGLELRLNKEPSATPASTLSLRTATAPKSPPATSTTATTTAQRTPSRTVPVTPAKPPRELRFSWAAVAGATSYDVAFYAHGAHDRLVLELSTRTPSAVVKVGKVGSKAAHSLVPGPYRWYVWPVRATGRDAVAVVRSTLTVS